MSKMVKSLYDGDVVGKIDWNKSGQNGIKIMKYWPSDWFDSLPVNKTSEHITRCCALLDEEDDTDVSTTVCS